MCRWRDASVTVMARAGDRCETSGVRRWFLLATLAACSFQAGRVQPRDGGGSDAPIAPAIDAPVDTRSVTIDGGSAAGCDPTACGAAGGTCSGTTCTINGAAGGPITCPAGEACDVACPSNNHACRDGLTCSAQADCAFHCTADHVCDNGSTLVCASGARCETFCVGNHACDGLTIDCGAGATCIYHCCGGMSCGGGFTCNGPGCADGGATCP